MKKGAKIFFILMGFLSIYASCTKHKTDNTPRIKNLKTMTLIELKAFLNGAWQLKYSLMYSYTGYTKYDGDSSLFIFYPIDSIKWVDKTNTVIAVQDKAIYTWKKNSYNDSAYNISFYVNSIGYSYNWTADRTINDTLIFVDNSRVNSSYYLTKKW